MASLLLASSFVVACMDAPNRRPVIVVTDCGASLDDEWALAHLAVSPAFELLGVVTTHAPNLAAPAAETSAKAVVGLLDRLPMMSRPRVVAGASRAYQPGDRTSSGAAFLIDTARRHNHERRLDVVLIGAATDVAMALRTEPTLADRIRVVAMGFEGWAAGGDVWNVKNDVKSWQSMLDSRVPLVIGDDSTCRRDLRMTPARAREILGDRGSVLSDLLEGWIARNGQPDAATIWDEVAVAFLLGLTSHETRPRPRLRDDLTFDHAGAPGTVTWVTSIDADRLWADLGANLHRPAR